MQLLPELCVNGRFLGRRITGVERVAHEITRALAKIYREADQAHKIEVLVPRGDISTPIDGISTRTVGRLSGTLWENVELPLYAQGRWLYSPCNIAPLFYPKSVVTINDAQVHLVPDAYRPAFRWWYAFAQPIVARRARVVTVPSVYSQTQLEQFHVVGSGKSRLLTYGCDHATRSPAEAGIFERIGLGSAEGFVLAIGSQSVHKNLAILSSVAGEMKDLRFVIVGDRLDHIFSGKTSQNSATNVTYTGRISDGEMRALLERAICLAFPSLTEGFGLPPLEAMAVGCPVIASNAGAIPEVLGDAAVYANPTSAEEWRKAIDHLRTNPPAREHMRAGGKRRAASFSWDRSALQLVKFISAPTS